MIAAARNCLQVQGIRDSASHGRESQDLAAPFLLEMNLLLRVAVMEQKERNRIGTYLFPDLQVQMTDWILLRGQ
jgi:hypothetical protein